MASTGTLSALPPIKAAGSIAAASATKANIAICQPLAWITPWASGAQKKVPIEPAAETSPKARLRRSGRTTLAAILAAMPEVVQASATPIMAPELIVTIQAAEAKAVMISAAA